MDRGAAPAAGLLNGAVGVPGVEIVGDLGRGAHALVYRVRRDGADYALKVLRPSALDDPRMVTAFRREAALLACVDHPAVARVYEVGQIGGRPYLIMELIEGRSLAQVLESERLGAERVVALAMNLAGALAAVHRVGVVHRDIKPQNILILSDGGAKLIDFGLAAQAGTEPGAEAAAGTFAYAAPEQTGMLNRPVDERSDLYGLGVMLFECLTGTRPFTAVDAGTLMHQHATAPVPDPRGLRPDVPVALAGIVRKLLAKDPDDRYQSGEGLLVDLRRVHRQPDGAWRLDPDTQANGVAGVDIPGARERPLVGRESELAALLALWKRARAGRGGYVHVEGPAGIGKSRLVRELVRSAADAGHLVLEAACVPDDPVPLAPLRRAVERYVQDVERRDPDRRDAAIRRLRAAAGPAASLLTSLSSGLARMLPSTDLAEEDREEQFITAVATFLTNLADCGGGAILHLGGAQWMDSATARIVRRLAAVLPDSALLLVVSTRTDQDPGAQVGRGHLDADDGVDLRIALGPLDSDALMRLAVSQLGGMAFSPGLGPQLTERTRGNPLALREYLRAMLDEGIIRPYWGTWVLDETALDGVTLPADVLDLVVTRLHKVGEPARELLTAAAAIACPFRPELLAAVCRVDLAQASVAVEEGRSAGIIERRADGSYSFLHERLRSGLLERLGEPERRALHQRIAAVLEEEAGPSADDTRCYALARHYGLGERERAPRRMFRACYAAGQLALAEHAAVDASGYLELAVDAAERAGIELDSAFHRTLAVVQLRLGLLDEARDSLNRALRIEPDRLRRAEMLGLIAQTYHSDYASAESLAAVERALAEMGRPLPRNPLVLALSTLSQFAAGLVVGKTGRGFGTASGAARERHRMIASLHYAGSMAAAVGMRKILTGVYHLRSLYSVNRLGPSPEYVRLQAGLGAVALIVGWRNLAERIFDRATAVATEIGDPRLIAHVGWTRVVKDLSGGVNRTRGTATRRLLEQHGQWLDIGEYLGCVGALCGILVLRGYAEEARAWHRRGLARLAGNDEVLGNPIGMSGVLTAAALGHHAEASESLAAMRRSVIPSQTNQGQLVNLLTAALHAAAERGEFDGSFTEAVRDLRRFHVTPRRVWSQQRMLWVFLAYARLGECRIAEDGARAGAVRGARDAVAELRRAADAGVLRAYYHAARASYRQLTGHHAAALRLADRADRLARRLDAPLVGCENALVRARALHALGERAEAERQAENALLLATRYGWEHRARAIRAEFRVGQILSGTERGVLGSGTSGTGGLYQRRLAALQEVSLAAATILDPRELVRVALDETIRIFGAERAFLFLSDGDEDELRPHLGRDASGADLEQLTGYGSTLVDRVRETREALVVTGSEQGAALGSESAVAHGLRSIMVAPLQLKGDLLGVAYLDSRIAKGVFTGADVDILMAITHHIAASLETARAAQLERAVHAAEQQRDLADMMRTSMAEISTTLDPDQVLRRVAATVTRALPTDTACLVHVDAPPPRVDQGSTRGKSDAVVACTPLINAGVVG